MVKSLLALIAFCLILSPASALAHKIHVFAYARGTTIHGQAYFTEDSPARNIAVTALDPAGQQIGDTTTDDDGQFTLEAQYRCDHLLQVSTSDGHGGEYTVSASEFSQDLPPRDGSAGSPPPSSSPEVDSPPDEGHAHTPAPEAGQPDNKTLLVQIVELRKQLKSYEDRIRLQDVLGGVGYILGVAGIAFYFLGAKKRPPAPSQQPQHKSDH
ncbi:MAG TPA: carboxypeptidase-like regulatory domain-containing protein [Thermoguttaceae bacterium]|nr:carboxypeptidase-like regulatory domain-containing protein [Thermoguttaceae bacterium]